MRRICPFLACAVSWFASFASAEDGGESPSGHAGESSVSGTEREVRRYLEDYGYAESDFEPAPDRWRTGFPGWDRYGLRSEEQHHADSPYMRGARLNPYRQNVWKADYPIFGQNTFFAFGAASDTTVEFRKLPTPAGVSTAGPGRPGFFGSGDQFFVTSFLALSFEIFEGNTAFKPVNYLVRITPVLNVNYLDVEENNNVNIDVREGTTRTDGHVGLQEAFLEKHLVDLSDNYDFLSLTVGIQPFASDFRGLLFVDNNLGARLSANWDNNRSQANLAYFWMLEKDTNSELNSFAERDQQILIATYLRQDFLWFGYSLQLSFHLNHDGDSEEVDDNGVPARPPVLGNAQPHKLDIYYFGWSGDGHIGRVNITHELFLAFGEDDANPLAGRDVDVFAQLFFLELSVDHDWYRWRGSFFWASGDDDPLDSNGRGFDGIVDLPSFAGGPSSFWIRQSQRLLGVNLVQRFSAYANLRSSKFQGQANFVNPGLMFATLGWDAELTQEVQFSANVSYLRFSATESLEPFVNQNDIDEDLGVEAAMFLQYRPRLTNNIQINLGAAVFFPGNGFEDLYEDDEPLYSLFLQTVLVF